MRGWIRWAVLPLLLTACLRAQTSGELVVGVSGSEPFVVVEGGEHEGIAIEIWQMLAAQAGWRYRIQDYPTVADAMAALQTGAVDAVVGPVSITAERSEYARFTQPFFSSRLAILSRTEPPTLWRRIEPFFSESFFLAVTGFLSVLAFVGTVIWLVERRAPGSHFPPHALHGIGSGVWFAIVTMSTVGYGDLAPKTVLGRIVTGLWIVTSVVAATSLVAGIAGTLTLTANSLEVIATADQLRGRAVATISESPSETLAANYGARVIGVDTLEEAYELLARRTADAIVFDRPQLQYFLRQRAPAGVAISPANYTQQNYGFAVPRNSPIQDELNLRLLQLRETGAVDRIVETWLGRD